MEKDQLKKKIDALQKELEEAEDLADEIEEIEEADDQGDDLDDDQGDDLDDDQGDDQGEALDVVKVKPHRWRRTKKTVIDFINMFADPSDIEAVQGIDIRKFKLSGYYVLLGTMREIVFDYGSKTLKHTFTKKIPILFNLKDSKLEIPVTITPRGLDV